MIEQYLKDSIPEPDRKAKIETLAKLNLMPERIYEALRIRDSLRNAKNNLDNIEKGFIKTAKDTSDIEDDEAVSDSLYKLKNEPQKNVQNTSLPKKNENDVKENEKAILPENKKRIDTTHLIK